MGDREGIIFFRSWRDAIREIPKEQRADAYEAIIDYALDGIVPESGDFLIKMIFLMAKPTIDRNEKAYQDGKRGGRPPGGKKKQGFEAEKTMVSKQQKPPFLTQETTETGTGTETEEKTETEEEPKPAQTPARVSVRTIFNACLMAYPISKELQATMESWLKYKTERRESYKEQGLRALMKKASESETEHGTSAVIEIIESSMANRYAGITWDRLRGRASPAKSAPVKKNQFTQMELRQDYDFEEIERESLIHD